MLFLQNCCIMFSLLFAMETEKKKKNYPMSRHAFRKYKILGTAHLHVHVPSYSCNSLCKANIKLGRGR